MTRFEVRRRDGLARTGIFDNGHLRIETPAVADMDSLFPGLHTLSHSNIPLASVPGTDLPVPPHRDDVPVTVHPSRIPPVSSGAFVMVANWHTAFSHPRHYVQWLATMKQKIPPDTAWYAPAAALPSCVHVLVLSGFDLFDTVAVDLKSAQGVFCLPEGEYDAGLLHSGVCSCPGCAGEDLNLHNRLALARELILLSHTLAAGHLRELVEARCRHKAPYTAILRHLDQQAGLIEPLTPIARDAILTASSGESLNRVEVRRFAERVISRLPPLPADVAVFLPCSAKKPYSLSLSHRKFRAAIEGRAHELIVTSPLGLVPREIERVYPAAHYDVPVTGYWDREEQAVIAGIIAQYLARHHYRRLIVHLDGGAREVMEAAAAAAGQEIEVTCRGRPTDPPSLRALSDALDGERLVRIDPLKPLAAWQFGIDLDTRSLKIKGRYPNLQVTDGRAPLFSLDPVTGLLRPTFAGWERIPLVYRVAIDDFVPEGDILAPGVIDADPSIRPGDEVLAFGRSAVATGRAALGGSEMVASHRGVAVRVRKVKKIAPQ